MGTKVRIEATIEKQEYYCEVGTNFEGLNSEDLGQMLRMAMLGVGYHPDNVAEVFGDEPDKPADDED